MKKKLYTLILIIATINIAVCKKQTPSVIAFYKQNIFPEGIAWWQNENKFLISSMSEGTIYSVNDKGVLKAEIVDSSLMSSVGIQVNESNNRLYVCNSHPGVANARKQGKYKSSEVDSVATLEVYDLDTMKKIQEHDLAKLSDDYSKIFCNDITFDNNDNAYVTNSFAPLIYKISTDAIASIFFEDEDYKGKNGEFHFNGIVWHKDGYLIVARHYTGELLKISTRETEPVAETINTSGLKLADPDGLLLTSNNQLVVVSNNFTGKGSDHVSLLKSNDNWQSAELLYVDKRGWLTPTSATLREKEIFILNAKLNLRFEGKPQATFEIRKFTAPKAMAIQ